MKFGTIAATIAGLSTALTAPLASARDQAPKPDASQVSPEALRLIDAWLDSEQVYRHIPAMSAAIVQGDRQVFATGYGTIDAAHTIPATAQTLYSICSISKLFTSVALMQQWEAGKVTLDTPITTYLPWAKLQPVQQDSVPATVRALLTHSSGYPRDFSRPYWDGPDFIFPTDQEVQTTLPQQKPLWAASQRFQYSNVGLTLVGDTVAAVTGMPYVDYAKTRVLGPLGMKDTYLGLPMSLYGTRLAVGWGSIDRAGKMELLKPFDTRGVMPAAGYVSTADDLSTFARWQLRLLRTGKQDVLKASTLREMQRVQFLDPDWSESWGLGFRVWREKDQTYVGHDGACPGYKTSLAVRPKSETAVIVLMTGMADAIARGDAVFAILDKRKSAETDKTSEDDAADGAKKPAATAAVDLEAYAGIYSAQPWASELVVTPWAGGLAVLSLPSSHPADDLSILKPAGKDTFRRLRDDGTEAELVEFERDASGKIMRLREFSSVSLRTGDLPKLGHAVP